MPLLIYGAELQDESQEITIDNFASLIDPQSWEEFMPKGVNKQKFNSIKKYYDPEIILCGRQAHPCHGSCYGQTERGGTHRAYNEYF